ncbi:RDD family protein [Gracilibacillus salinarum]|uniref:RDD family protein n=1 Tax=Gracilibacillus salinarum TaxID=2932255 RepID=A0ABY4GK96_9BACI|nr:RDD family protein [Gracilibacillus salinarum]UOQ84773.1 RDD family protein [Gracilibacillus salinarum]
MTVMNPAGFLNRLCARFLDGILITLVSGFLTLAIYGEFLRDDYYFTDWLGVIYGLLLPVVWYGYTIGRRLTGNRIVKLDGSKVGIGNMLLRDIVAGMIYAFTFGIGLIVSAFMVGIREDKRAIHDFIARTYVTTEPATEAE